MSLFIVAIALSICAMLLMKMARMRAGEMGLMMALGYHRRQIQQMLLWESLLLSALAAGSTSLVSLLLAALSGLLPVQMDPGQFAWSIVGTVLLVWLTISVSNGKLLRTDPAEALRA